MKGLEEEAVMLSVMSDQQIVRRIFNVRGTRVMLDSDLALLYDVDTKVLNQAVKRNLNRFPPDFMFQLTSQEWEAIREQAGASNWGGRRTLPYAFTEHGVVMLSSLLNSNIAVEASLCVVRAFVKLRLVLSTQQEIANRIAELELRYDGQFAQVFQLIQEMMLPAALENRQRIGFHG